MAPSSTFAPEKYLVRQPMMMSRATLCAWWEATSRSMSARVAEAFWQLDARVVLSRQSCSQFYGAASPESHSSTHTWAFAASRAENLRTPVGGRRALHQAACA